MSTVDCPYFDRDYKKRIFWVLPRKGIKENHIVCFQTIGNNV